MIFSSDDPRHGTPPTDTITSPAATAPLPSAQPPALIRLTCPRPRPRPAVQTNLGLSPSCARAGGIMCARVGFACARLWTRARALGACAPTLLREFEFKLS